MSVISRQICNSTDTLTLQHLSHPPKFSEYLTEVRRQHTKEYIDSNSEVDKSAFINHVLDKYDYIPVAFCPNCNCSKPTKRVRKTPEYRCLGCKHEFDNPVYKSVDELVSIFYENADAIEVRDKCFVSKQWGNNHHLSNIKYRLQRERITNQNSEEIEKEAFLLYLDDDIKYLAFEDTITACRRCAYKYDIKRMDLCLKCKEHYKGIEYPTCIQCLPDDKRKSSLDAIEFGKEWQQMHRDLGID